ncbi:hypothetical protein COU94_01785 [Candidatus Shapirobacteria bacterium CG10_big_fil_rev_8_21_14_0_10_38_8]|nr:MAG: hypothetical protein COU94_01785 [Candidatus Shapirobacteria bacterium CG10_big_fil_rev_8_21_14_0_10_38_8]
MLSTKYFGFIAIVDGWKIKIIIKQVGNGAPFFWSVIPNWVTNRKRVWRKIKKVPASVLHHSVTDRSRSLQAKLY